MELIVLAIVIVVYIILKSIIANQKLKEANKIKKEYTSKMSSIADETRVLEKKREDTLREIQRVNAEKKKFQAIINETEQSRPKLAKLYSDFVFEKDKAIAEILRTKKNPAVVASQEVSRIAEEKKHLVEENKKLRFLLGDDCDPLLSQFEQRKKDMEEKIASKQTMLENNYLLSKHLLESEIAEIRQNKENLSEEFNQEKAIFEKEFSDFKEQLCSDHAAYELITTEATQSRPELSELYAKLLCERDITIAERLLENKRPAIRAADSIKAISAEKRRLIAENKALTFQIEFYESLFPWLEEFKEVPIDDAIAYATQSDAESEDEYEHLRNWLSPEEYQTLGTIEKYQLALDRWKQRKKTDWEIGIEYERYIGYRLEQQGYKVEYFGATMGLGDMGRDLLATKDGVTLVIQCKRWAKDKTIHEKHICQLYGSVAVLATQNPNKQYKGVFITSAGLSETAKLFADYSNIQYVESCPMADYPVVKCNLSNAGEKIYHLPFDQQYDRVIITPKKGEFFAMTVADAEDAGFRRAFRWHSS